MSEPSALTVLTKARAMVAKGWTQGAFARNKLGTMRSGDARDAVCWCAASALNEACAAFDPWRDALRLFKAEIGTENVIAWNDATGRTQADVLAAFDAAIAKASP